MHWFISDEHYGHERIIEYNKRPFKTIDEMDETIISNSNSVVSKNDITVHGGDFTLWKDVAGIYKKYINRLNGNHIFLKGSHDYWLPRRKSMQIWEKNIFVENRKYYFVVCHYAMRVWARSHYNSLQLYGHSHGKLPPIGKQHDITVDNNDFYPLSEFQIVQIMKHQPDNFNLIKDNSRHTPAREGVVKPLTEEANGK
jgi:calcineurin-like phosphoesterase family protein